MNCVTQRPLNFYRRIVSTNKIVRPREIHEVANHTLWNRWLKRVHASKRRPFRWIFHLVRHGPYSFVRTAQYWERWDKLTNRTKLTRNRKKKSKNISAYGEWNESDWIDDWILCRLPRTFLLSPRTWLWFIMYLNRCEVRTGRAHTTHTKPSRWSIIRRTHLCALLGHISSFHFCLIGEQSVWVCVRCVPFLATRCAMNSLPQESRINYNFWATFNAFNYVRRRVEMPPSIDDGESPDKIYERFFHAENFFSFLFLPGNGTWSSVIATTHLGGMGRQSATNKIHA